MTIYIFWQPNIFCADLVPFGQRKQESISRCTFIFTQSTCFDYYICDQIFILLLLFPLLISGLVLSRFLLYCYGIIGSVLQNLAVLIFSPNSSPNKWVFIHFVNIGGIVKFNFLFRTVCYTLQIYQLFRSKPILHCNEVFDVERSFFSTFIQINYLTRILRTSEIPCPISVC